MIILASHGMRYENTCICVNTCTWFSVIIWYKVEKGIHMECADAAATAAITLIILFGLTLIVALIEK